MKELDPLVWFSKREVHHIPRHFTRTATPLTTESTIWVMTTLKGRYGQANGAQGSSKFGVDWANYFYFEDPAEAMMYELRWSGQ